LDDEMSLRVPHSQENWEEQKQQEISWLVDDMLERHTLNETCSSLFVKLSISNVAKWSLLACKWCFEDEFPGTG